MQAIILAAGMGRRLGDYTKDNTKCMVPVNGVRLIDRLLGQLAKQPLKRVIFLQFVLDDSQRIDVVGLVVDRVFGKQQLAVGS